VRVVQTVLYQFKGGGACWLGKQFNYNRYMIKEPKEQKHELRR